MDAANRSDRSARSAGRRVLVASAVVLVAAGSAIALLAGAALAYDQVAILSPSPDEIAAEPGEEVVVSVGIRAGGHDDGVAAVELVVEYDPDSLEVREIEAGPWLGGEETTVETEESVSNADGTAVLEAEREPVGDGASGEGELATLTIAVDEDAPPGETSIDFESTDVELANGWPMPVHDRGVAVAVDGSEEDDPIPGTALTTIVAGLVVLAYAVYRRA